MLQATKVALLLTLFIQYIEGFERVIEISELNDHDELSSDGIVTSSLGSGSGSYILENSCCIYGSCTCPSLYNALVNLDSNVLINITTDVELSSIIPLVDLANITITGHNNPTVNCNDSGGLHFILQLKVSFGKGVVLETSVMDVHILFFSCSILLT